MDIPLLTFSIGACFGIVITGLVVLLLLKIAERNRL